MFYYLNWVWKNKVNHMDKTKQKKKEQKKEQKKKTKRKEKNVLGQAIKLRCANLKNNMEI